jgi:hypothetical protein
MVVETPRLRRFEADYQRTAYRELSLPDALALYQRLLGEARVLDPGFGQDWQADLAPDLAIARAINGLAPA